MKFIIALVALFAAVSSADFLTPNTGSALRDGFHGSQGLLHGLNGGRLHGGGIQVERFRIGGFHDGNPFGFHGLRSYYPNGNGYGGYGNPLASFPGSFQDSQYSSGLPSVGLPDNAFSNGGGHPSPLIHDVVPILRNRLFHHGVGDSIFPQASDWSHPYTFGFGGNDHADNLASRPSQILPTANNYSPSNGNTAANTGAPLGTPTNGAVVATTAVPVISGQLSNVQPASNAGAPSTTNSQVSPSAGVASTGNTGTSSGTAPAAAHAATGSSATATKTVSVTTSSASGASAAQPSTNAASTGNVASAAQPSTNAGPTANAASATQASASAGSAGTAAAGTATAASGAAAGANGAGSVNAG